MFYILMIILSLVFPTLFIFWCVLGFPYSYIPYLIGLIIAIVFGIKIFRLEEKQSNKVIQVLQNKINQLEKEIEALKQPKQEDDNT